MEDMRSTKTDDDLSEHHRVNGNHNADPADFNMTNGDVNEEVAANGDLASEIRPATVEASLNVIMDTVETSTESHLNSLAEESRSSLTQTQDFASPRSPKPAPPEGPEDNAKTPTQNLITSRLLTDGLNPDPGSNSVPEASGTQVQDTGGLASSRTLAHSQPAETLPVQMANNEQGSAARIYINTKVTPVLLEGMKWVAKNEPEKPLKWLSEFLAKRSADIEGM